MRVSLIYLDQPCHLVGPDHERCDQHRKLSAFSCQMIFDSRWDLWECYSFDESAVLEIFEHVSKGLCAYAIEALS